MKKPEIFHTIKSTGQTFTSQEWGEWCNKHREHSAVVFTHKDFQFNDCDVCVTPHTMTDYNFHGCQLRITTAESPNGRWDYGIWYGFDLGGSGHAPSFIASETEGYASEKAAVFAALLKAEGWLKSQMKAKPQEGKEFMAKIREYKDLFDPRQLELFQ